MFFVLVKRLPLKVQTIAENDNLRGNLAAVEEQSEVDD
jgi:hypothetical protein